MINKAYRLIAQALLGSFLVLFSEQNHAQSLDHALISPSDEPTAEVAKTTPLSTAAKLNVIEIHQRARQTTVILHLKNITQPNVFSLENPARLIIDLPSTSVSSAMPKEIADTGLIQRIRFGLGPAGHGNVRMVLDLAQPCQFAVLIDNDDLEQTLTIILTATAPPPALVVKLREPADLSGLTPLNIKAAKLIDTTKVITPKNTPAKISFSDARLVNVVIDPGHGGKDSGAIGINRLQEKNVVLAISQRLITLLNRQPGIHAQLTRKGDYFIGLRERLRLARLYKADVFMAIHADAFINDSAQGASVFALSQHGATSEAARWLAEKENISEFAGLPFKTTNYQLKSVLLDMSQTATNQDSVELGQLLLQNLTSISQLHANVVEQAGFMVLKSPDIPSVLVETGFISNPKEASLLASDSYQDKIANALMEGIVRYCQQNPPPASYFEMQYKRSA